MNAPTSNALASVNIPSLQMAENELVKVLQSSLYPGAELESIKLVIGYCKGQNLDPMLKPVHIVPMSVKLPKQQNQNDKYEWRDVIMPGIGLYRTTAARTEEYAGCSDPEFGPVKTLEVTDFKMDYPEWCKVAVRRLVQGHVVEFSAVEYWLENYATKGRDSKVPNAMWQKRPYGQIAKCAEAQALRKGFPEVGAQPTAEEMEGKTMDAGGESAAIEGQITHKEVEQPKSKSGNKEKQEAAKKQASDSNGDNPPATPITEGALKLIRNLLNKHGSISDVDLHAQFGVDENGTPLSEWKLEDLTMDKVNDVLEFIRNRPR